MGSNVAMVVRRHVFHPVHRHVVMPDKIYPKKCLSQVRKDRREGGREEGIGRRVGARGWTKGSDGGREPERKNVKDGEREVRRM